MEYVGLPIQVSEQLQGGLTKIQEALQVVRGVYVGRAEERGILNQVNLNTLSRPGFPDSNGFFLPLYGYTIAYARRLQVMVRAIDTAVERYDNSYIVPAPCQGPRQSSRDIGQSAYFHKRRHLTGAKEYVQTRTYSERLGLTVRPLAIVSEGNSSPNVPG
jgi:hypothetical protein